MTLSHKIFKDTRKKLFQHLLPGVAQSLKDGLVVGVDILDRHHDECIHTNSAFFTADGSFQEFLIQQPLFIPFLGQYSFGILNGKPMGIWEDEVTFLY